MRKLKFGDAINEALRQMMEEDERVFLIGQGVTSPWYVGATTTGLVDRFGPERVNDSPVSENGVTGLAVGAALAGMKPVVMHPRMDFMYYAMDPIANQAANWHYMFGGQLSVPMVIWGIINRGNEQSAQHAQALHAMYAHIPGLKVVMPSCPYDAKGLLIAAIQDDNPVLFVDERWLYEMEEEVPEEMYSVPISKAVIRKEGNDLTILATSWMVTEALEAAGILENDEIHAEVIDLRTAKPMDEAMVLASVSKTGRVIIADGGWRTCGFSAEVAAVIAENIPHMLKAPVKRVTLPDAPAPASAVLEKEYFPNSDTIYHAAKKLISG